MSCREREEEQDKLNRIAATLLRLAFIAQLVCALPLPVRAFVLSLLRPAEAVARAFAIERTGGALALPPPSFCRADYDGRAAALRLARCFRALASVFRRMQDFAGRLFRGGPHRRLARYAPAIAWPGHSMEARGATALRGTGRTDTS